VLPCVAVCCSVLQCVYNGGALYHEIQVELQQHTLQIATDFRKRDQNFRKRASDPRKRALHFRKRSLCFSPKRALDSRKRVRSIKNALNFRGRALDPRNRGPYFHKRALYLCKKSRRFPQTSPTSPHACAAVCCSVLLCVAVWCSVLQCVAVCCICRLQGGVES